MCIHINIYYIYITPAHTCVCGVVKRCQCNIFILKLCLRYLEAVELFICQFIPEVSNIRDGIPHRFFPFLFQNIVRENKKKKIFYVYAYAF